MQIVLRTIPRFLRGFRGLYAGIGRPPNLTLLGLPVNWDAIVADCSHMGQIGHFASVAFTSIDDPFDPSGALYRGHGIDVEYEGLDPLFTFGRFLGTA